ncbi:MAG: methylmalonyl-CoA mutase small subunit [Bacteroidales bacterium]|nr:methylmalonyl-CoA mutase small subunit [Bacteroidales bacterium]
MEQLSEKKLFTEFPPITTAQWEEKIAEDLKGADYQKKLVWKTLEGFEVKPYYRNEDLNNLDYLQSMPGQFPFTRGTGNNDWEIRQDLAVDNIENTNSKLINILNRGVTSPGLIINEDNFSTGDWLYRLLHEVHPDCISLNYVSGRLSPRILELLVQFMKDRNLNTDLLKGSFDFDPLGNLTVNGNFYHSETEDFMILRSLLEKAKNHLPLYRILGINGLIFNNAGATIVQQLAFALSAGNEYLSKLSEFGFATDEIAQRMHFTFGVGPDYFMEIAKLRAARHLWAKIVEAYHPKNMKVAGMFIHAVTTDWNKTVFDPYVNMLRCTTEAMSAALGGAGSITVTPFDSAFAPASDFSLRIARNTQIILKEEAHFNKVTDPAAGSYYIEKLTDSIATHAWELFLETEDNGGYSHAFKSGTIRQMIAGAASKKIKNFTSRKETLVGTNQYPQLNEQMSGKIDPAIISPQDNISKTRIAEPLQQKRVAKELEDLRFKVELAPKRPKVFMLTIGNPAMRRARAAFSCNFFACGGYEIIDNNGFNNIEEGVKAASDAKADLVILCSSDEEYARYAPEAFNLLNKNIMLVIAGEPPCKPELENAGITNFISLRSDIVETLKYYHKSLVIL